MKEELFGTIMHDGKMYNLDKDEIDKLEQISKELKEKINNLEIKAENVLKQ